MNETERRIWGIHTQDDSLFLKDNTIAIGWGAFGDLTDMENDREAFKKKYAEVYPQDKKGAIALGSYEDISDLNNNVAMLVLLFDTFGQFLY